MSRNKKIVFGLLSICAISFSANADDGMTIYSQSGNTVWGSDGSTTTSVGGFTTHRDSDGNTTNYNKTSTGLIGSDLSTVTDVGDTSKVVRDSEGNLSSCVKSGNSLICN